MFIDFVSVFALYGNDYNIAYQRDNESQSLCEGETLRRFRGQKKLSHRKKKIYGIARNFYG